MRVALVHDDLVQWGGAERVFAAISEIYPDAPIYTSVIDKGNSFIKSAFGQKKIHTSFIQKIPFWRSIYKLLLPVYPIAFEQFDFSEYDLVISSTTRFAKSIITKPGTKHVCYCHTPPRFLWGQNAVTRLKIYFNFLRRYDMVSSRRVDQWLAGSGNAQKRLEQIYGVKSTILYPFVDLERFADIDTFDGGYLLVVSRLVKYKRVDLAVKAAQQLGLPLKIVGQGPERKSLELLADNHVEFVGNVKDRLLSQLLAGCKALIVAGEEDFGLTPLEAQALGKPVVGFKKGGVLETVVEGRTGYLFKEPTVGSLVDALLQLDKEGYNEESCRKQAEKFSKECFTISLKESLT